MRKNYNDVRIKGYVYQSSLSIKTAGPRAKNPGVEFIAGDLEIATDESAVNVIPVHFTYVTPTYSKSGKSNPNFAVLKKIVEAPERTWIAGGKDNALKVQIGAALAINDFVSNTGDLIAAKRVEGSFVTIINDLGDEDKRNTFSIDTLVTKYKINEPNPDRGIDKEYMTISGAAFDFRNALLPVDFQVYTDDGISYFEDKAPTNKEPLYINLMGYIKNQTIKVEKETETAFGGPVVTSYERKSREWIVLRAGAVPYEFGDEEVMTPAELKKAIQDREVHLAEVQKRDAEYKASRGTVAAAPSQSITESDEEYNF